MVRRLHADFRLEKPLRPIGADNTAVANAGRTTVAIAPEDEPADRRVSARSDQHRPWLIVAAMGVFLQRLRSAVRLAPLPSAS
jgi:hypothetical protein